MRKVKKHQKKITPTYQSLIFKRIIDTPEQQPERPQVFKTELQDEVCHQDESPHKQKSQIQKSTVRENV